MSYILWNHCLSVRKITKLTLSESCESFICESRWKGFIRAGVGHREKFPLALQGFHMSRTLQKSQESAGDTGLATNKSKNI